MESYKLTLFKTIIWRVIATLITFLSGWLLTGDFKIGLAVGGLDFFLKFIGYFIFERFWQKLN